MIVNIINNIFSIPYFLIGILTAIMLDLFIYKSKASTRLTFLEIWGCTIGWPFVTIIIFVAYFKNNK